MKVRIAVILVLLIPLVWAKLKYMRSAAFRPAVQHRHDARQEPLGSFAVNSQKLFDYAFQAVHVTAETAKRLAAAHYGRRPARSYFQGCSKGGRQALVAARPRLYRHHAAIRLLGTGS
jgi:hypothetical protein